MKKYGQSKLLIFMSSKAVSQYFVQILSPVADNCTSWISRRGRMAIEIARHGAPTQVPCMPSRKASDLHHGLNLDLNQMFLGLNHEHVMGTCSWIGY